MRKQRLGLIQTADQLRFSYIAFLQSVLVDSEEEDQVEGSDSEEVEDEEESMFKLKCIRIHKSQCPQNYDVMTIVYSLMS